MIKENKIVPAFKALQHIFITSRWMAGKGYNPESIYDLLDGAEFLAGLAARIEDKTEEFEDYLKMICEKHGCHQALSVFNGSAN